MKTKIITRIPLVTAAILFPIILIAQNASGWSASKDTEERLSIDLPEFNFYESKVASYTLPQLLTSFSGRAIINQESWNKIRRPELLEIFRKDVYGCVPSTIFEKSFKVVNSDSSAMDGKATLKEVDITIASGGNSLTIRLTMFTPNNIRRPVPLFLLINNRGIENTDATRKVKSEFWPAEEVIARGYGIAVYRNADVDPDNFDHFKNGIHHILDKGVRKEDSWGTLAAWAWGASRCLDYLITDPAVNKERVAVVGHSRGGKTALWAGAEDTRFGMVIANESGCGGAALARRKLGETVERINTSFPHWFCMNYRKYNNNEDAMPFDMHMLLALTAPRPLYIDAAAEDLWGDPKGCYLALYHSLPAYRLFDRNTRLPEQVPQLNKQVISGNVGFHIRDGEHALSLRDWNHFMDFADSVWQ